MDEKLHRAARALIVKAFDRSVLLFWLVVLVLMFLLLVAPLRSAPAPSPGRPRLCDSTGRCPASG